MGTVGMVRMRHERSERRGAGEDSILLVRRGVGVGVGLGLGLGLGLG